MIQEDINITDLYVLSEVVEQVLSYSQSFTFNPYLSNMMEQWLKNKEHYIKLFGGVPIYRTKEKIRAHLSPEVKSQRFSDMIESFEMDDEDILNSKAENGMTLKNFLIDNKSGFYNNRVVKDCPELKIKKGTKLLKCFRYFLASHKDTRKAQDKASLFIHEDKIEGYLYLSVHPLDFLTLSETNCGWRSCHSLTGEYRAGNLSYMLDNTTIIAYLADDKVTHLDCLPEDMTWLNKQWRMLIHTNNFESVIYYNKQYPFHSEELLCKVYDILGELRNNRSEFTSPLKIGFTKIDLGSEYGDIELDHNYIMTPQNQVYDTIDFIDDSESLGFNDLVNSPSYTPIVSVKPENISAIEKVYKRIQPIHRKNKETIDKMYHNMYDIKIGEPVTCVMCGERQVGQGDSFLCDLCLDTLDYPFIVCEYCGSQLHEEDDMVYIKEDEAWICSSCLEEIFKEEDLL